MLTLFIQPSTLQSIGYNRITKFLLGFTDELRAANLPALLVEQQNGNYVDHLAAFLADPSRLPERLRNTLLTLENAASETNHHALESIIQRRLGDASLTGCPLDRALELWFVAPEELSKFATMPSNDGVKQPPSAAGSLESTPVNGCKKRDDTSDDSASPSQVENQKPAGDLSESKIQNVLPLSFSPDPSPEERDGVRSRSAPQIEDPQPKNQSPTFSYQAFQTPNKDSDRDEHELARLARLTPIQYDRVRKVEARNLRIRVETLDAEIERRRQAIDDAAAANIKLPPIEPWPEPVNGAEVLNEASSRFSLFVASSPGVADAFTLWTGHIHPVKAFYQTPRLHISSPEPECGKSTAMDLIAAMAPRALRTDHLTAPVLFRVVEQSQPTLLLDEVDTFVEANDELCGLLNAGHKRGGSAYRCEGERFGVRAFGAFTPAALAGIGTLRPTLHSRSIFVLLLPALPGEIRARFDGRNVETEKIIGSKLARWAKDNFATLEACNPKMPESAHNRVADNWRPLFAVAEVAGGDWPVRALNAFNHLTKRHSLNVRSVAATLLSDIRKIFIESGVTKMSLTQLVQALCAMNDHPWLEAHKGRPITETWLGAKLRTFDINSHTMRIGERVAKGYNLIDFANAFARFLDRNDTTPPSA